MKDDGDVADGSTLDFDLVSECRNRDDKVLRNIHEIVLWRHDEEYMDRLVKDLAPTCEMCMHAMESWNELDEDVDPEYWQFCGLCVRLSMKAYDAVRSGPFSHISDTSPSSPRIQESI